MVTYLESSFVNARGQRLFSIAIIPDGPPKAVVAFHHGIGEYILRYKPFLVKLAEAGYAVYGHDMHGHGRSEPKEEKLRVYVDHWEDLVDDSCMFMKEIMAKHPGLKVFCSGQSLGGLIAALVTGRMQKDLAGVLLFSSAIDVEWTPMLRFQASIGNCLAACIPYAKLVPAVRAEDMNADPKLVAEYLADKEIYHDNVKARMGNEVLKAFEAVKSISFTLPIYAHHGDTDRCTSLPAVQDLLKNAPSTDKTMKVIKDGYHEIFNGPQKDEAIKDIIDWLDKHTGSAPAAAAPEQVQVKA